MSKGRVTLPADNMPAEEIKAIIDKWGADAIRDSDGTHLPDDAKGFAKKVYGKYFLTRGDNEWAKANPDEISHSFIMSEHNLATENSLKVDLLKGYLRAQFKIDLSEDSVKHWEVIDRTTGDIITDWAVEDEDFVVINNTIPMHEYTVSFLARTVWNPVHAYNAMTNGWDVEPEQDYNPYCPKTYDYMINRLNEWCEQNPDISVIRFTTFFYNFAIYYDEQGRNKLFDWLGYSMSVSPKLLDDFEAEYGYKLRAEHIVDAGHYNNTFRVPSKEFLDYMDFVERFVAKAAKECVDIAHKHGKEAMMFMGDNWIGAELYGKHFSKIGLDAVVGSVASGVLVREITDVPNVKYREGRYLPYFFPDTFYEGNDPTSILNKNWVDSRRAIMRKPLDRIGYGGYLSLAAKFPDFMDRVAEICDEFRTIYDAIDNKEPHIALTVAILNCWGEKRRWFNFLAICESWVQKICGYQGILESLSGLPVDVKFLSFEDIRNGVPEGIDVIINAGDADTAFSGGDNWLCPDIVSNIRKFVYEGGGFIGVGQPSAARKGQHFFQLFDVLGVDEEQGYSFSELRYNKDKIDGHFILEDAKGEIDYGDIRNDIYAMENTTILDVKHPEKHPDALNSFSVKMAVNNYGKGRAFYTTGLPYSFENCRILYRAMLWAAGKEDEIKKSFSTNINTECNYYPNSGKYAVVNNSYEKQETTFYDINGNEKKLTLEPMEIKWL